MNIRQETKRVCIDEQIRARRASKHAMMCVKQDAIAPAISAQQESAYHASEAMLRLFRLIGTE